MASLSRAYNPQFLFIQHDCMCPPQLVAKACQLNNIDYQVVYSSYHNAFTRIEPSDFKGIVVLGGNQSAYDKYPWLETLKTFLKKALDQNVPVLGLCLGAQILANIIGGRAFLGDKGGEYGYYDIQWTEHAHQDAFCQYIQRNKLHQTMPYTHNDTFTLPPNHVTANGRVLPVKLLGCTDTPYIAMFKVGELTYGIQAHPECDDALHKLWIQKDETSILKINKNPDVLCKLSSSKAEQQDTNGCLLLTKWFHLCLNRTDMVANSKL